MSYITKIEEIDGEYEEQNPLVVSNNTTLTVSVEYHDGIRRVYPDCMKSQLFADLAGKTTLTDNAIDTIKQLGYTFKVLVPEL